MSLLPCCRRAATLGLHAITQTVRPALADMRTDKQRCHMIVGVTTSRRRNVSAQQAASADLSSAFQGTPVPKTSVLVLGGTGSLGRQVVRRAIDEGYDVRCIVRPRPIPADFLRDWGATTVQVRMRRAPA